METKTLVLLIPTVNRPQIPVRICVEVKKIAEEVDSSLQVILRVNGSKRARARDYMEVSRLDGVWGEHLTLEVDNVPPDKEKEVAQILDQGRKEIARIQAGIIVDKP